jgi:RNA polymerase sigma-70 factor (ECF subfamily)
VADLRIYLVRAALYALRRRRNSLAHLSPTDLDALAEDCAQDALMAILGRLGEFRGESRFTTWVYKFAINIALVAARREGGKRVPLDEVLRNGDAADRVGAAEGPDPDGAALRTEAWGAIREAMRRELTERQRQALTAIVFDGIPLDELVRHWGSNRNAVYKVLHDARRKLKASLERRDLPVHEVLSLFSG